ncbi:hypothetical protein RRF57_007411 [Xylaria bambusicola]|uniref:Uncharacterized protein n=1 Tax=Xylaria bambusicola TaxID=326684 RepID=A0AAN7Z6A0_9PEZI
MRFASDQELASSNAPMTSARRRARGPVSYNFFADPTPNQANWLAHPVPAMAPMPMVPMPPMPPQRAYSMPVVRQPMEDLPLNEQPDCLFTDLASQVEGMPENYKWS